MFQVSSYNCKSFKRNIGGIVKLCDVSDIVFIQEHWLFPSDLSLLNNVHSDYMAYGISSIDPRGGELGVLRVREHPLSAQVHPLTAKSTLSKLKKTL